MDGTRCASPKTAWPWKARALASVCGALPFGIHAYAFANNRTDIRVRLERVKPSFTVTGMGLTYPNSGTGLELGFKALKVSWTKAGPGLYEWRLQDRDSGAQVARFRARTLKLNGMDMRVNLKPVPDSLAFMPAREGADLIATMDLETYIRGVLPAEMPSAWPLESLKAQAIAARTFALYKKGLRAKAAYDVESDVMDQVFLTPLKSLLEKKTEANVARAVQETKGQVLFDSHGKPLAAYFHADCGGHTEEARNIWGGGEVQGTAVDDGCPVGPNAHWKTSFAASDVAAKIRGTVLRVPKGAELASLDPIDRTESGRIAHLQVRWSDGSVGVIAAHDFRMLVGHDKIRSTNFKITVNGSRVEIEGQGFGHGVGMCQWGAKHLASSGVNYEDILKHYYPKARLSNLDEMLVASIKSPERL